MTSRCRRRRPCSYLSCAPPLWSACEETGTDLHLTTWTSSSPPHSCKHRTASGQAQARLLFSIAVMCTSPTRGGYLQLLSFPWLIFVWKQEFRVDAYSPFSLNLLCVEGKHLKRKRWVLVAEINLIENMKTCRNKSKSLWNFLYLCTYTIYMAPKKTVKQMRGEYFARLFLEKLLE